MILMQLDEELINSHGDLEDLIGINFKFTRYFNCFSDGMSNDYY